MTTILPHVRDMTGLDNYNLSAQSKFNRSIMINNLLSCLPSPVCLVAHNGNPYNFPLLKAEMKNTKTQLNSEILCADCSIGIKKIFRKRAAAAEKEEKRINRTTQLNITEIVKFEKDALACSVRSGVFEEKIDEGNNQKTVLELDTLQAVKEQN